MIYKEILEKIKEKNKNLSEIDEFNLSIIIYYRFLKESKYFNNRYHLLRLSENVKSKKLNISLKSTNNLKNNKSSKMNGVKFVNEYNEYQISKNVKDYIIMNNKDDIDMLLYWKDKIEKADRIEDLLSLFNNNDTFEMLYKYQYFLNNENHSYSYSEKYDDDLLFNIFDFELNENKEEINELSSKYLISLNKRQISFKDLKIKSYLDQKTINRLKGKNDYFLYLNNEDKVGYFNYHYFEVKKIMTILRIEEFLENKNELIYLNKYENLSNDILKSLQQKYLDNKNIEIKYVDTKELNKNNYPDFIFDKTIERNDDNIIYDVNQEFKKMRFLDFENCIKPNSENTFLLTLNNGLENVIMTKLMFSGNQLGSKLSIRHFSSIDDNIDNIKLVAKKIIEEVKIRNIKVISLDIIGTNAIKKDVNSFISLYNEIDKYEDVLVINEYESQYIKKMNNRKYDFSQKIKKEMKLLDIYTINNMSNEELEENIKKLNKIKKMMIKFDDLSDSLYLIKEKEVMKEIKTKILNIKKEKEKKWIKNEKRY